MDSQQLQEADDLISQLEAQLAAKLQTATPSQPGDPWWEEEEEAITSEAIASRAAIREHLEEKTQQDYEARATAEFSAAASRAAAASENSLDASNGDKALTAFSESLSRCPDATRSRIQAVARTVTRHGHTASATTRLTVVGALLPEDVTHVTPLLDATFDLPFILTVAFAWRVALLTILSTLPVWVVKIGCQCLAPRVTTKLS